MEDEHLKPQESKSQLEENFTDAQSDEAVDGVVKEETIVTEEGQDVKSEESSEIVNDSAGDAEIVDNTESKEEVLVEAGAEVITTNEESSEGVSTNEVSADGEESEPVLTVADVVSEDSETKTEDGEEVPIPVVKKKSDKKWYSLRVISGKEKKIKERIELELQRNKWETAVTQVLVPTEKVYKIRAGKKVILERNILPGYILVEAVPSKFRGEIVTAIANIPNVIHFLGRNHPIPMHQSEANRMLGKVDESQDMSAAMIEPFIIGETIKIIDGPFKDFVGDIKEVNEERKKMKVIVKIFGRGTEVELNFMQVEKQS